MNTKTLLSLVLFFGFAALEILLLCRRLEAKVQAGTLTRESADKQRSRQWNIWVGLVLIFAVFGIGRLLNLL